MTCFEAEIIKVYAGEIPKEIVLVQDGTVELTLYDYPLFTYGNEMFLFLEKIESRIEWFERLNPDIDYVEFDHENAYAIAGGPLNVWDRTTADSGEVYIMPKFPVIAQRNKVELTNYGTASESGITNEAASAAKYLISIDSYANQGHSPQYVYKLDDMVTFLESVEE